MPQPGYTSISIPSKLLKTIDALLKELDEAGFSQEYKTKSEFIKEAIRHRIEALRQIYFIGEPPEAPEQLDH